MSFRVIAVLAAGMLASAGANAAGDAAKGAEIATVVCAACHGPDGNSVITANPKLAGQHPEYLAKQLNEFKSGKRANAVMGPMSATLATAEDVLNVAAYFAAQAPKGGAAKSNGNGSDGERIYKGGILAKGVPACASCHSPNGAGIPAQYPRLAGQHAEYTVSQLKAFHDGTRRNNVPMAQIAARLSDAEMNAVADYAAGLR
jgi:cytochrome c553